MSAPKFNFDPKRDPDGMKNLVQTFRQEMEYWLEYQVIIAELQAKRYRSLVGAGVPEDKAAAIVGSMRGVM